MNLMNLRIFLYNLENEYYFNRDFHLLYTNYSA